MCKIIAISGTPGVGKSSTAKLLAEKINAEVIDLSELIISKNLYTDFDEDRESYIVDEDAVKEYFNNLCYSDRKNHLIIVHSHFAEIIPNELIYKFFVLRINPLYLAKRLAKRCWSERKIVENIESEIIGVCMYNALSAIDSEKICEINVTNYDKNTIVNRILNILNKKDTCDKNIDWINKLNEHDYLAKINQIVKNELKKLCR